MTNMCSEAERNFLTLFQFVINCGAEVVRDFIEPLILSTYHTFERYLCSSKHFFYHQFNPRVHCCQCPNDGCYIKRSNTMKRQLFESLYLVDTSLCISSHEVYSGKNKVTVCICKYVEKLVNLNNFDLSDLNCIFQSLNITHKQADIQKLLDVRNKLSHAIDTKTFETTALTHLWEQLEEAMSSITGSPRLIKRLAENARKMVLNKDDITQLTAMVHKCLEERDEITMPHLCLKKDLKRTFQLTTKMNKECHVELEETEGKVKTGIDEISSKLRRIEENLHRFQQTEEKLMEFVKGNRLVLVVCEIGFKEVVSVFGCQSMTTPNELPKSNALMNFDGFQQPKSNSEETEVELQKEIPVKILQLQTGCTHIGLEIKPSAFTSPETLHSAIQATIEQVLLKIDVDTIVGGPIKIRITFNNSLTKYEKETVDKMLSAVKNDSGISDKPVDSNEKAKMTMEGEEIHKEKHETSTSLSGQRETVAKPCSMTTMFKRAESLETPSNQEGTTYVYDDNDLRQGDCTTVAKYPGIYLFSKHTERSSRRLNSKIERLQEKTSFVDCICCQTLHSLYDDGIDYKLAVDGYSSMEDIINDESMSDFYQLVLVDCWLHLNKGFTRFSFGTCLNSAVERRKTLVCRLLLCYAPEQDDNCVMVSTLQIALCNDDKDITKAIAWYITRRFVEANAISFENIKDIWPALKCMCDNKKKINERCSDEIAIIVEQSTGGKPIPEIFCSVRVICLADDYHCNNVEGKSKSTGSEHHNEDISEIFSYFHQVDGGIAEDIFIHHSKTTIIGSSLVRSDVSSGSNSSFSEGVILQLFCKLKGYIPVGEQHYPKAIDGVKTKVIQGSFAFGSNVVRVGDKIGPADTKELKTGTLGGFVRVRGDLAFLTCCHVVIDMNDLTKDDLSLDDSKKLWVNCYTKDKNRIENVSRCGRLRDAPAFETDNKDRTSIDAALVTFDSDVEIDENDFVAGKKENFSSLGLASPYLNDNCVDYKTWCYSITKPEFTVLSVGATSGFSKCDSKIKENKKEMDIELTSFLTISNEAVIKEVKKNVEDILKDSFSTLSDDIKKKINDKCCVCYSQEMKEHIFNVLDKIISERNDENISLETKHQRVEEIVRYETDGKLPLLVNTVHMQEYFLRKSRNLSVIRRASRRMFNQIHIPKVPFMPGDSGTCVYIVGGPARGCIGMAIANHPKSGCIATPITEILKHFKIRYNLSETKPSQKKTTEETAMDTD